MATSSTSTCISPLVVAMDFDDAESCLALAKLLTPQHCRLKVGKELFTIAGPALVKQLIDLGFDVFLDLKFHDIPNTVAKAVKAAANLGVWMVNVHASGGEAMMLAAKDALASLPEEQSRPLLIAVTVLTSMTVDDLPTIGIAVEPKDQVLSLAALTNKAGLDGVVCSAQEAQMLKQHFSKSFTLVTPGIRPLGAANADQRRILTPQQAVEQGSDYLVIGRPITQAAAPLKACEVILQELGYNSIAQ